MANEQTSVESDIKAANKSIMDRVHAVSKERMVAIMKWTNVANALGVFAVGVLTWIALFVAGGVKDGSNAFSLFFIACYVRKNYGFMYSYLGRAVFLFFLSACCFATVGTIYEAGGIVVGIFTVVNAVWSCYVIFVHPEFDVGTGISKKQDFTAGYNTGLNPFASLAGHSFDNSHPGGVPGTTAATENPWNGGTSAAAEGKTYGEDFTVSSTRERELEAQAANAEPNPFEDPPAIPAAASTLTAGIQSSDPFSIGKPSKFPSRAPPPKPPMPSKPSTAYTPPPMPTMPSRKKAGSGGAATYASAAAAASNSNSKPAPEAMPSMPSRKNRRSSPGSGAGSAGFGEGGADDENPFAS